MGAGGDVLNLGSSSLAYMTQTTRNATENTVSFLFSTPASTTAVMHYSEDDSYHPVCESCH